MKKIIYIFLLLISTTTFAQQDHEKRAEKIKSLRIAFISNKLDLSPQEAQVFWPVFNKFDEKQTVLHKQNRQLMFKLRPENTSSVPEKEMQSLLEETENIDVAMQNNKRQFVKDLQGVIPPQKILLLKRLEEDFKHTLLRQFKKGPEKPPRD